MLCATMCVARQAHYRNGVQSMCKYCDVDNLEKMHDEVDAILSEDYNYSTEDRLDDALNDCIAFTVRNWGGATYYFLDGTG